MDLLLEHYILNMDLLLKHRFMSMDLLLERHSLSTDLLLEEHRFLNTDLLLKHCFLSMDLLLKHRLLSMDLLLGMSLTEYGPFAGTPLYEHGPPAETLLSEHGRTAAGTPLYAGQQDIETASKGDVDCETLIDPGKVITIYNSIEEKELGKVTRILASKAAFGDTVLKKSTVYGDKKRGLAALDKTKIRTLVCTIHHHKSFNHLSKADFDSLVKKKILPSLSHYCKELRKL